MQTNTEYNSHIYDLSREFNDRIVCNNKDIVFINWKTEQLGESDNISMGSFCYSSAEFTYLTEDNPNLSLSDFSYPWTIYSGLVVDGVTYEVPIGKFYTNSIETDDNGFTYTIKGYDVVDSMSDEYDTTNGLTSSNDIVDAIETTTGMTVDGTFSEFEITSVPEGTTNGEMLGFIAGYDGDNLRVNSSGEIEKYWYTNSNHTISQDEQYEDELKIDTSVITINSITSGTSDNVITVGSGYGITYTNPYVTIDRLTSIMNSKLPLSYSKATVKYRGNGLLEIGDKVSVETTEGTYITCLIMSHSLSADGGFEGTIESMSSEEQEAVISNTPTDKKITQVYSGLKKALQEATDSIIGNEGGTYKLLIDENDKPYGWQVVSDTDHNKGWQFTQGGLGYSSDGFNSLDVAIDMNGNIAGNFIAANSISIGKLEDAAGINNAINGVTSLQAMLQTDDNGYLHLIGNQGEVVIGLDSEGLPRIDLKVNGSTTTYITSDTIHSDKAEFNSVTVGNIQQATYSNGICHRWID